MNAKQVAHYSKSDLESAEKMLRHHLDKLANHINSNEWPMACSALRAIETECTHANRVAASLSVQASAKHL